MADSKMETAEEHIRNAQQIVWGLRDQLKRALVAYRTSPVLYDAIEVLYRDMRTVDERLVKALAACGSKS